MTSMLLNSIVEYYGEHERYKCGYCKNPNTSYSHGLWAHKMTVTDYQELIDRGWRRSGKYCYKPTMELTCCPSYTIRCKALEFKPSKSQKKILKRVNKFLCGENSHLESDGDRKMSTSQNSMNIEGLDEGHEQFMEVKRDPKIINIDVTVHSEETNSTTNKSEAAQGDTSKRFICETHPGTSNVLAIKKDNGPDPTKPPSKKAKLLRRERRLEKLREQGVDISKLNSNDKITEKPIEVFINELPEHFKSKLELKLVRTTPPSPEWLATSKETHELYVKYQMKIHGDTAEKCTEPKFVDFLVKSPLTEEHSEVGPPSGYGSFHQQYWLDGKIIAVGVIDILPRCVSSVYFFYDPDYTHLSLGTYGALREIAFVRHLHTLCPELKYYYLGYYIHSCSKMRYKGNFHPSDLLCPETYKWFPMKDCLQKLDLSSYSRLDPDIDDVDENYPKDGDIDKIPILFKGAVLPYRLCKKKVSKNSLNTDELVEYLRLVGSKPGKQLILVI